METRIARLISFIFHPLLVPTYAVVILINFPSRLRLDFPFETSLLLLAFIFLSTFVFPLLIMLILRSLKVIDSLEMKSQRERTMPLIIMAVIFYLVFQLLKQGPQDAVFNLFMLGSTLLVLISLIVNYFMKISIHLVAHGGLSGAIIGYTLLFGIESYWLICLLIFISGLVGYARLKLHAHSQPEIYTGFLLGAGIMLALFWFV